jgi:hypothetical protein
MIGQLSNSLRGCRIRYTSSLDLVTSVDSMVMQNRYLNLLLTHGSQSIASAVLFIGLVSVSFAFWQTWPPTAVLVGASIGGALSPSFWKLISRRAVANRDAQNEDFVNFPLQWPESHSAVERESRNPLD